MGPPRSGVTPHTLHPSRSVCAVLRGEDLCPAELRPVELLLQALERGVADRDDAGKVQPLGQHPDAEGAAELDHDHGVTRLILAERTPARAATRPHPWRVWRLHWRVLLMTRPSPRPTLFLEGTDMSETTRATFALAFVLIGLTTSSVYAEPLLHLSLG